MSRIKNVILDLVAPKFACRDCSWLETGLYLLGPIRCDCYWNTFWMPLWALREEKGDWSAIESTSIWLTCPAVLEGPLGSLGPIKGLWAPFWLISYLLFTPHSPHNFLEHLELCGFVLLASIFHFSQLFLSILHLRPVSIFLLLSVFFF